MNRVQRKCDCAYCPKLLLKGEKRVSMYGGHAVASAHIPCFLKHINKEIKEFEEWEGKVTIPKSESEKLSIMQ